MRKSCVLLLNIRECYKAKSTSGPKVNFVIGKKSNEKRQHFMLVLENENIACIAIDITELS